MNKCNKKIIGILCTIIFTTQMTGCAVAGHLFTKNLDERVLRVISEKYPDNQFEITSISKSADFQLMDQDGIEFNVMVVDSEEERFKCQDDYVTEYLKANHALEELEQIEGVTIQESSIGKISVDLGDLYDEQQLEDATDRLEQMSSVMRVPFTVKDYGEVSTSMGESYFFSQNDGEMNVIHYECTFDGRNLLNTTMQFIRTDMWQKMETREDCADFLTEDIGNERETELLAEALLEDGENPEEYIDQLTDIFYFFQNKDDGDISTVTNETVTEEGEELILLEITSSTGSIYDCYLETGADNQYGINRFEER